MSFFITFEGIEGSGKSTQIALLGQALQQLGYTLTQTREPGGCPIADQIRSILLHPDHNNLDATSELLLYAAARAQHVHEVIRPALAAKRLVLCDRYTDATSAYQGEGRNLDRQLIQQLNQVATMGTTPDLTILIDLPAEIGIKRALAREVTLNDSSEGRFEREEIAFHQRVRQGYLALSKESPERFIIVDGTQDIQTLAKEIMEATRLFLQQKEFRP